MKPTKKTFCCTKCQRAFTRSDHLKRHHLHHSGQKPYACVFCDKAFVRCDNLRDHYVDGAQRGDRKIPETGRRGRRRHACQSCTSLKIGRDGNSPCGPCIKRGLECKNESAQPTLPGLNRGTETRNGNGERGWSVLDTPPTQAEIYEQPSDRGSIHFLLNGDTDQCQ